MTNLSHLIKQLKATDGLAYLDCNTVLRNPDGPEAATALTSLIEENERLREALKPFAQFVERFDNKPLRTLDDELYAIHVGTEWEASIRLSDFRKALNALEGSPIMADGQSKRSDWRCVECKRVIQSIDEPEQCMACNGRTFAQVQP